MLDWILQALFRFATLLEICSKEFLTRKAGLLVPAVNEEVAGTLREPGQCE